MPVILPLLLVSLILAVLAIIQARQARLSRESPVSQPGARSGRQTATLVRRGRVGDAELGAPSWSTILVAPVESPTAALKVLASDGTVVGHVNASDVVAVRAWSKGHLMLTFGGSRREYGHSWALSPAMAGWEINFVTATGDILRCYGAPGSSANDDLSRLRARLHGNALAQAS
jgi:hypothetical protein